MIRIALFLALIGFVASCGKSDSDSGDGSEQGTLAEELEELPNVSGSVVELSDDSTDEAEDAENFNNLQIDDTLDLVASSGLDMGDPDSAKTTIASGGSRAGCETYKKSLLYNHETSRVDLWQCMIRKSGSSKIYFDGKAHIYSYKIDAGDEEYTGTVELTLTKTDNKITGLKHKLCFDGEQTQFLNMKIEDGGIEIETRLLNDGELSYAKVTSSLNSTESKAEDGSTVSGYNLAGIKKMTVKTTKDDNNYSETQVYQSDNYVLYNGYGKTSSATQRLFSFYELVDSNDEDDDYSLSKLAIGDGAAYFDDAGTTGTQGWSGETAAADSGADALTKVTSKTSELYDVADSAPDLSFTDEETLDCDSEGELEFEISAEDFAACDELYELSQTAFETDASASLSWP